MGFNNASPVYITYGIDDKSTRVIYPEPVEIPQHLPKSYFFAKKGTVKPTLTKSSQRLVMYGEDTFNPLSKWFNHSTRFMNLFGKTGNTVVSQRVLPSDIKPEANARLYIDLLEVQVDNYLRNSDGSIAIDPNTQAPKIDQSKPKIDGFMIKFIKEQVDQMVVGDGTIKPGTMEKDGVTSNMYPIMDLEASEKGDYYNNVGIVITPLKNDSIDSEILSATKSLPFGLSVIKRVDKSSTGKVVKSIYDTNYIVTSLKRDAINPFTEQSIYIDNIFPKNWVNEDNPDVPLSYSDFKDIYIYNDNIDTVLGKLVSEESKYISNDLVDREDGTKAATFSWFDFTTTDADIIKDDEKYLVNLFTAQSSKGVPYFSIQLNKETPTLEDNQEEIQFTNNTPVYLSGGSDGTLSNEEFEKAVVAELEKYLDPNSEVQDMAVNPESIFYDSGYTLPTKKKFRSVIALRKDIFVHLTTYDASLGTKYNTLVDERGIGTALKTAFALTPESEYFGTPVTRAMITIQSGLDINQSDKNRVPLSYDLANKFSKYMGAGNGKWKTGFDFDLGSQSKVTELTDIQPDFIPAGVKPILFGQGLVWAQPYDLKVMHFPALQSIYDNDTSVLNSPITVMAICTLEKVAAEAWRNFTGDAKMSRAVFADRVLEFVQNRIKDRFDNRFTITSDVYFTEGDKQRGWSWHLVNKIYAPNLKTTMIYNTQSFRIDDLKG